MNPDATARLDLFLSKYCKYKHLAKVHIRRTSGVWRGYARRTASGYDVDLQVGEAVYPRRTRLGPGMPELHLRSWEDEYVVVLAHELRHVHQFELRAFSDPLEAERDAEVFAAAVLRKFQGSEICY